MYKSQFQKMDPYDWFCCPGSHFIKMLLTLFKCKHIVFTELNTLHKSNTTFKQQVGTFRLVMTESDTTENPEARLCLFWGDLLPVLRICPGFSGAAALGLRLSLFTFDFICVSLASSFRSCCSWLPLPSMLLSYSECLELIYHRVGVILFVLFAAIMSPDLYKLFKHSAKFAVPPRIHCGNVLEDVRCA